jgi:hypothetical protein
MDINYYSLTAFTTKEYDNDSTQCKEAEHYIFFNSLWKKAEKTNTNIRNDFMGASFYSGLTDNDQKNKIKAILDRIYPETAMTTE